jgi:hypothetical protein
MGIERKKVEIQQKLAAEEAAKAKKVRVNALCFCDVLFFLYSLSINFLCR